MAFPLTQTQARGGRAWLRSLASEPWPAILLAVVVVVSLCVIGLIGAVLFLSIAHGLLSQSGVAYSLSSYRAIFFDPFTYLVLWNTAEFSLISLVIAFLFGFPAAWLVERTDFSAKTLVFVVMTVSLLIPGFAVAMGWLFLLDPRIGVVNQWLMAWLHTTNGPLSIASVPGMAWVQGVSMAPVAFIMTSTVLRSMDPSLEEAAEISGARRLGTIRSVTLPILWPGVLAAALYIVSIGINSFDVPAIIGWTSRIFTFSTYIYLQVTPQGGLPHYDLAASLSAFTILLAVLLSFWYTRVLKRASMYQVVRGKGYRPRLSRLGAATVPSWLFVVAYIVCGIGIPIVVLLWASLLPYFQPPSAAAVHQLSFAQYRALPWDLVLRGASNTALLMVLTPTITVTVSLAFAWLVLRSRIPGRVGFDFVAFLPHVIPSIVFGVAGLLVALFVFGTRVPIYGTVWLLLMVFVIVRLSIGTRMMNSSLIQIHPELEEAASISGARLWATLRNILGPLLLPSILYAWVWIALLSYRELTIPTILSTTNNVTLTVVVWNFWLNGGLAPAAAVTVCIIGCMVPLILAYWFFVRRSGIAPQLT